MQRYHIGTALSFVLFMSACTTETIDRDEVWKTIEACNGSEVCAFSTLAAAEYNRRAGQPNRGGVSIRGAETDGRVLSVSVDVPEQIKNLPVPSGLTVEQQLTASVTKNLCRKQNTRRFFEQGGELKIYSYLPSGDLFAKNTIASC